MAIHPPKRILARRMRSAPSTEERTLWALLRGRRLEGLKFRRQVPIGPYVADFLCLRHRLIVEADGPFHDPESDQRRDAWLAGQGFHVLRFGNQLIHHHSEQVLAAILQATAAPPMEPNSGLTDWDLREQ